jgi:hypothetical protein
VTFSPGEPPTREVHEHEIEWRVHGAGEIGPRDHRSTTSREEDDKSAPGRHFFLHPIRQVFPPHLVHGYPNKITRIYWISHKNESRPPSYVYEEVRSIENTHNPIEPIYLHYLSSCLRSRYNIALVVASQSQSSPLFGSTSSIGAFDGLPIPKQP